MSRLRVESFTISLDGFGAGPNQDIDNPLGVGGGALNQQGADFVALANEQVLDRLSAEACTPPDVVRPPV